MWKSSPCVSTSPKLLCSDPQLIPTKPPPNEIPVLNQNIHSQLPLKNDLKHPPLPSLFWGSIKIVPRKLSLSRWSAMNSALRYQQACKSLICWYFKRVVCNLGAMEATSSQGYEVTWKVSFCPEKSSLLPLSYRVWKHHIFLWKEGILTARS